MNKVGQFEGNQGCPTSNVSYLWSLSRHLHLKGTPKTIVMILQPELQRLLSDLETDRVEKTISATKTDKFGEAICAFANDLPNHNLPGYLVVGANDDGSRCGMQVNEQLLQTLSGFRNDGADRATTCADRGEVRIPGRRSCRGGSATAFFAACAVQWKGLHPCRPAPWHCQRSRRAHLERETLCFCTHF